LPLTASDLRRVCIGCFNFAVRVGLAVATRGMAKELARRDDQRGRNTLRWFTPDEAAVVVALARIIVPSDEETPGLEDIGVLGPPAVVMFDRLVATSCYRQQIYSRGLLAFDVWAVSKHGHKFAEIPEQAQKALFAAAQDLHERWTGGTSAAKKAVHRLRALTLASRGTLIAAQLYDQIRSDSLQLFYTSRVAWTWLGYDGPPMDKGYQSLVAPREP